MICALPVDADLHPLSQWNERDSKELFEHSTLPVEFVIILTHGSSTLFPRSVNSACSVLEVFYKPTRDDILLMSRNVLFVVNTRTSEATVPPQIPPRLCEIQLWHIFVFKMRL